MSSKWRYNLFSDNLLFFLSLIIMPLCSGWKSYSFSWIIAIQCWWEAYNCFWWHMGRSVLRNGCKILPRFACWTCCYAGCQGNMHYKSTLLYANFKPYQHVFWFDISIMLCSLHFPSHVYILTVIQEALRSRGLKDDTTCIVVDIIPPDNELPPTPAPKRRNKLRDLFFRKRSRDSVGKLSKKLSAINIVEELFEEGSAMLAER